MVESVLAPVLFAVVVLALLVYVGVRHWRRSMSGGSVARDAVDEERPPRRTGTGG